ncbi:MAG: ATP-binding cassette domain-containing protein, partial [Bacteroidota bacterium]
MPVKLLNNHLENNNPLLLIKNLRIDGVSKENNYINLELKKGEIHAIMGESGAGKSGIAHVLAGMIRPEHGTILIKNQSVEIKNPLQPLSMGIGVLFQNTTYSFIPHLTVQEYLYIWTDSFIISSKRLTEKTIKLLNEYEINVKPHDLMFELNQEECRLLSLMKMLAHEPFMVVLDEPTSDLSEVKKQHFFRIIRKYAEKGGGVLYLSNKLDEILQISDRVTILKDGGTVDCFPIEYAKKYPKTILGLYFGREDAY